MLRRSLLRSDCAAVLASGSCRRTRCAPWRALRSNSCGKSDNASALARADTEAAFLAAAEIAPAGCHLARERRGAFLSNITSVPAKPGPGRARRASEAPRSTGHRAQGPRAAGAPRDLTWRICLNAAPVRARSESCARAMGASTAGQSAQPTASANRRGLSGAGFARAGRAIGAGLFGPEIRPKRSIVAVRASAASWKPFGGSCYRARPSAIRVTGGCPF